MNCPFCDLTIIKNQTIFEDKNIFVLHNLYPANKGQCLVIPRRHVTSIRELNINELTELIKAVQHISKKLKVYLKPEGFNYGFNEGNYAGQRIEHFHFHIIPRFTGDYDKVPKFHVFHRPEEKKRQLNNKELKQFVDEFKKVLQQKS